MDFIHVRRVPNGMIELRADADLLFYAAITLPLVFVTVGVWFVWDSWTSRRRRKRMSMPISPC